MFLFGSAVQAQGANEVHAIGSDIHQRLDELNQKFVELGVDPERADNLMIGVQEMKAILQTLMVDVELLEIEHKEAAKQMMMRRATF